VLYAHSPDSLSLSQGTRASEFARSCLHVVLAAELRAAPSVTATAADDDDGAADRATVRRPSLTLSPLWAPGL
jgi:hypothetical protein